MRLGKVEICGVDTAQLTTLKEEEKRALLARVREGDGAARDEMVTGNLRLVLSIIQKFNPKKESMDDLFQVGCIGLIKAIDNFNLDMDVRFSTYAVPMIIGELRRYQRDNSAVRVSRGMRDLAYRALQAKEEIVRREGREATLLEISKMLEVSESAVGEAIEAIAQPISLFDSVYGEGDDSVFVIDKLSDDSDSDDIWIENIALKEALKKLSEREKNIIARRFYKGRTQMEIADEIGISQAQVSRIEKGAVEKLRRLMQ